MNSLQSVGRDGSRTPDFEDPYDTRYETKWEATPIKPFKTQDEYLFAMVEDLAEWLNSLYSLDINPNNFYEKLENGSVLCKHANNLRRVAIEYRQIHGTSEKDIVINDNDIKFRVDAKDGSFNARDNLSNFITWCRHSLNIKDVLLFESDDLVLRKNEKSFILCLLEVARRGGKIGMPVPLLVQFEEDIEREIKACLVNGASEFSILSEADSEPSIEPTSPTSSATTTDIDRELESGSDADHEMDSQRSESPDLSSLNGNHSNRPSSVPTRTRRVSKTSRLPKPLPQQTVNRSSDGYGSAEVDLIPEQDQGPPPQVMLEPEILLSLHERVRELINECMCPNQFPMIREAEGKYKIGEQNTLIFVRILRNHVMVRIGGGWDTLEHYLDKHDPCKCKLHRSGGRSRNNSIGSSYRRSPKRRISVEIPKVRSRDQSVESVDRRSFRSPSPQMKRDESNETLGSLDSNHNTEPNNGLGSGNQSGGAKGQTGSFTRGSEKRPSQLPRRLSQVGTGTEEFLRKRRDDANASSQERKGNLARSAPTSPTRRVRPLSSTAIDLNESGVQSDVYRRLALAGGRETGSATQSQRTRSVSVNVTCQSRSRENSQDKGITGIPVSPTMRRKHRSGSLNVTASSRVNTQKLGDRRDNAVIMISRDTSGRHRLNSNSSCESSDLRSLDGSSQRSPTDSEKSATECVTRRLLERERSRSLSVDRNGIKSKIPSFDQGSRLRASTCLGEKTTLRPKSAAFERGSRLRSPSCEVNEGATARNPTPKFERGSNLRATTGSMGSSVRPQSIASMQSRKSRGDERQNYNIPSTRPRESPLQRSGSLRNPRTDHRLLSQDPEGVLSRNSTRRRTITGRETRAPRQPVPAELNAENLARYLQSYQNRVAPRETRSETRSNASSRAGSRASSRASSPGTSRLRPRIPVPSHLKSEPKTPIRRDSLDHAPPSRIPLPVQHKRLLSAQNASSRSHSLPDLIANMMVWCQRTINIDNCDTRSITSAESMSPTPSLRTDQDSGYEDNPQKGSPNGPEELNHLRRTSRTRPLAEPEGATGTS